MPEVVLVGRPTKSAAKFAEKPSIILGRPSSRKQTPPNPVPSPFAQPSLVLDTNIVLDWLVFRDPSCHALGAAIEAGAVRWLAAEALRQECDHVLARGVAADRSPDLEALDGMWQRHAHILPAAPPPASYPPCRCTDPDDQKFIDLALHTGARWLLSRDRAVLKLAGRARRAGLLILPPTRWSLADRA